MMLQTLLRWCVRIVLPFIHWRVPVALLRGQVEGRAANDLAPIEVDAAPPEVRSLARAKAPRTHKKAIHLPF